LKAFILQFDAKAELVKSVIFLKIAATNWKLSLFDVYDFVFTTNTSTTTVILLYLCMTNNHIDNVFMENLA